ncbi:hypothetical protein CSC33_2280 [Pseudomonas aeruginosa]|nr:hypothetical protein CSC33_2280 [Pseudomonas aeruginosa]
MLRCWQLLSEFCYKNAVCIYSIEDSFDGQTTEEAGRETDDSG